MNFARAGLALAVALVAPALAAPPTESPAPVTGIAPPPGSPENPLSLSHCVDRALRDNVSLQRERLRREELDGQGWQAMSTGLPSLDLTGNWSRGRDPSFVLDESLGGGESATLDLPEPYDDLEAPLSEALSSLAKIPLPDELESQTFWRSSVDSEWEFNPFRLLNSVSAVKIAQRQHDEDVRTAEHSTVEQTMNTFYEVSRHHERVASIQADIAARREFLDISRRRFELELATPLDTLRAAVSLANLKPVARRARKDLRNACSRLNILMGREPIEPLSILPVTVVERTRLDLDEVMALTAGRPDLESLALQVDFLSKQKGVYGADQRPTLSVSGSYGYVSRTMDDLIDRRFDFWNANVSVTVPIFDGFYTKGRVEETEASIARTRKALEQARREARLEVATSLEELAAAQETLDAAELNQKAAESALEQMTLRYELGKAEYLDVLTAQSDRFSARSNLIDARFEVLARTATLKRALGIHPTQPLSHVRKALERQVP